MAAKRHMDIKRNITGHNIIIADITGYSLIMLCIRRRGGAYCRMPCPSKRSPVTTLYLGLIRKWGWGIDKENGTLQALRPSYHKAKMGFGKI